MLTCLRVRSFAIIDALEVELEPGLNVVTGETGAGKSILVDALGLVLGGRARPDTIRTGEQSAEVEALFELTEHPEAMDRLREAGIAGDGELVIRRVVTSAGRSRAYVNGTLATARELSALAAGLADISSQHEHHSLVDASRHLEHLDAFGRLEPLRGEVGQAHAALVGADEALEALRARALGRSEREDLLRYQIGEIDALAPADGELEALGEERERLRHGERLLRAAGGAEDALYARDEAICEVLGRVGAELSDAARFDPRLERLAQRVTDARTELEDAARELGTYARELALDPEHLAQVEERLDALRRIARKYGGSIASTLAHRARAERELTLLSAHEEQVEAAQARREAALGRAREAARALSAARKEAAGRLGAAICAELATLGMGEASVIVEVAPLEGRSGEIEVDGARLSATGVDRAELLIAPNPGEEARPLRKIASGGELSRAMLAIKRVLAGLSPSGLYVFDEVDAGVGGAVAEVIGEKLREVARHHQVLCITHLPQIAVFADAHFCVRKEVAQGRTVSEIAKLGSAERLEEIARMLGGVRVTGKTRAAAEELLAGARR